MFSTAVRDKYLNYALIMLCMTGCLWIMFSLCKSIIVKCYGMCDYSSNEICFTLYFKCVLIVLKCMWLYSPVFIIKRAIGMLQIGIRAKVSTLSLDGPVERSLDRKCEEKFCLEWPMGNL